MTDYRTTLHSPIRRLDTRKDLSQVADLIEICFGEHLDPDGHLYLHQIRQAASNHRLVRWSYAASELVSYPLNGFVWEEEGRILGNLSMIPFYWKREWIYLIANVAVHPEVRRQGIASQLTRRALEHLGRTAISAIWLHVREENLAARHLYESFNFHERCTRDTWVSRDPFPHPETLPEKLRVTADGQHSWSAQLGWLNRTYPPEVAWHLSFDPGRLQPGLWGALRRHLTGQIVKHWAVYHNQRLIGSAIWEPSFLYADPLWIAASPGEEEDAILALLPYIKQRHSPSRLLYINYPAYQQRDAFEQAGFDLVNTLIWMQL